MTVKLTPRSAGARCILAAFDDVAKAGDAVAAIIGAGIIPAGLEMMDKLTIAAVEPFVHAGYPLDAEAILLCESDGTPEEVAEEVETDARAARALRRDAASTSSQSECAATQVLVGTQGGVSGGRAHLARLLLHRRHDSAARAGARAQARSPRCRANSAYAA